MPNVALDQCTIGPCIDTLAGFLYVVKDLIRFVEVVVAQASTHQARLHLVVRLQTVFLSKSVDNIESLLQLLASAVHLHQDTKSEIRRLNIVLLHVGKDIVCYVHSIKARASIEHRVVHGIDCQAFALNLQENLIGFVQIAFYHIRFHDRRVRHSIGLASRSFHALNQISHRIRRAYACLRVNERCEDKRVHLHVHFLHFFVDVHSAVTLIAICETLDDRRVHECVWANCRLPLVQERQRILDATVAHQSVEHTAEHVIIRHHATPLCQVLPKATAC
mmetsp:Transcript_39382/g.62429  ORF Transcript_39382/g.62429 Transcript_39382/m.62429 type:complete len:277 (-) Transcript_39382:2010-2840(-)